MSRHPENQPDRIRQFTVSRSSCFPSVSQWSDGNIRKAWPVTKVAASREDRVRPGALLRPACPRVTAAWSAAAAAAPAAPAPHESAAFLPVRPLLIGLLDAVHLGVRNPPLTNHGRRREPLQDRGGRRHAVWQNGASARFRQGLLPRGESVKRVSV